MSEEHSGEDISISEAAKVMSAAMREAVKKHSLFYLFQGGLMILGGIVALIYPLFSAASIILLLGWLLLISGLVQGLSLIGTRHVPHFWPQLVSVALACVIGVILIRNPATALLTVTMLLIVFFMVEGISKVIFSLTIRPFPNWGWVLASGVLGIALALILFANPAVAVWLLGLMIGVLLICEGAALGYLAWQVRKS